MDVQDNLIQTIQILASKKLKNMNFTKSFSGKVKEIDGLNCLVESSGQTFSCIIPSSLKNHVETSEIVVVQDLYGGNQKRVVQGVISSNMLGAEFHIYDPVENRIVSSILELWDESSGSPVSGIVLEIE